MPSPASYPWYSTVQDDTLEQGDILCNFEVVIPRAGYALAQEGFDAELQAYNVVLMTQSCDIESGKVQSLLLCPVFALHDFIAAASGRGENWGRDIREKLRQGNLPGYHLLNETSQDGLSWPLSVVDFHEVHTAPTDHIRGFVKTCGKRLRICPPYKEHLAQAFARFFMRVGLPVSIPREKLMEKPIKK